MMKKIESYGEIYEKLRTSNKELLIEKGFLGKLSVDQIFSRIHSEVGELINAYKKGLPKEEQSEELADIVIYLFNLLYKENTGIYSEDMYFTINEFTFLVEEWSPWFSFNEISRAINEIRDAFYQYNRLLHSASEDYHGLGICKNNIRACFKKVINFCEICASVLDVDLGEAIENKMKKNFDRPYQYNTSPEHFNEKTTF